MQRLDYMLNTNRLAIKTEEMGKFVIEKINLNNKNFYQVLLPKTFRFEDKNINIENSVFLLSRLDIYSNFIELHIEVNNNMAIRTYYIIDSKGIFHNISSMYVPEPEEKSESFGAFIRIKGLKHIITDPDMFLEMKESGKIKAENAVLQKFDLYEPKYNVIIGEGKNNDEIDKDKYIPNMKIIK